MTMEITQENYYSQEANQAYFTASQIKTFMDCPSRWIAERCGKYKRQVTKELFHGQYIDTALTEPEKFDQFCMDHSDEIFTGNKKYKPIQDIDAAIRRVKRDEYFMRMITGEAQVIITLEDFHGHPYKCMLDILNKEECFLTDLKSTFDINGELWTVLDDGSFAKLHWIAHWRYPLQIALYREAVLLKWGFRAEPFIAGMEKKAIPNFDVFAMLDPANPLPFQGELKRGIEAMDRMDLIQHLGPFEEGVDSCGRCEWCLMNKELSGPKMFKFDPRSLDF
jgi:hypothetical protein